MRRLQIITIIGVIISSVCLSHAEDGWATVRHFEEVATFEIKFIEHEEPIVFDWGFPLDISGSGGIVPEWADVLTTSSDLSVMTFDMFRALFTTNNWLTLGVDESNFNEIQKSYKEYNESSPQARFVLIYSEGYIKIGGQEFLYLLKVVDESVSAGKIQVEKRRSGEVVSSGAIFLKKVNGVWKHHACDYEDDKTAQFLMRFPFRFLDMKALSHSKRSYYDPISKEKNSLNIRCFPGEEGSAQKRGQSFEIEVREKEKGSADEFKNRGKRTDKSTTPYKR